MASKKPNIINPYSSLDIDERALQQIMREYMPEVETAAMSAFREIIRSWCIRNRYLIPHKSTSPGLVANVPSDVTSLQYILFTTNLKSLTKQEDFDKFVTALRDTDGDRGMSRIYDLHIQLCTQLDTDFVIRYMNKLYQTLEKVVPAKDISWYDVFDHLKVLWVLHAIQTEMRDHAVL